MSPLRSNVLAAKRRLAEGHQELKRRHREGCPGVELCEAATDLRDELVLALFEAAMADLEAAESDWLRRRIALVAHGGYGRRDVAPYSDVDLMVLCAGDAVDRLGPLAERLVRDVFDAGLVLGHSVRTPREACRLSCQDATIATSLIESRFLAGSRRLFDRFLRRFRRTLHRQGARLIDAVAQARLEERVKFGETVYLLEPNIKRSPGGLRDRQLVRWIGEIRYGLREPRRLGTRGLLSEEDVSGIQQAGAFLLRLRNEMHFHAGKPSDVLSRPEQLRIAEHLGYQPAAGMLPVEQFMRDYFRHTERVSHAAARFLAKARGTGRLRRALAAGLGHRVEGGLRVGPTQITATRRGLDGLRGNLDRIMQLVDLANRYDKPIAPETWEVVRREAAHLPPEVSSEACRRFRSLLSHPARLGESLRGLHEVGLLERFIPAFAHARGLLQFNQYHKYTVDEHCFRAVEQAAGFFSDPGTLGRVYRGIARKHVLHLALLIHDLGKGHLEDHVEVGVQIAQAATGRLALEAGEADAVEFLVRKHMKMNHLALRRDTGDEQLTVRFAVEVGTAERLGMLFVLTAADLGAVGPGTWTSWKAEVLTDLYHRAVQHLAGESPAVTPQEQLLRRRRKVQAELGTAGHQPWFVRHLAALPGTYLHATPPGQIAADLRLLARLGTGEVNTRAAYQPETQTVQFTIATREQLTPGIFHKLTGALTGKGLEILSAEINTLLDGLVLDRFRVLDPDYAGPPPPERLEEINRALADSLTTPAAAPPPFRHTWRTGGQRQPPIRVAQTRVEADNNTSQACTVLDIFAADRPGLLYRVTRCLFELGLSVQRAKIGTFADQVVDVFYVVDRHGSKIDDAYRLQQIRMKLLEVILARIDD